MITPRWALGVIVAASAASASTTELQLFSRLLKRQEPGTPEYNCHDNCGQAIIQARNGGDGVCTDDGFVSNYENCLQCSGPDNVDIWRFYGNSLSRAGESCGLPTTPLSGEQPDVGPAIPAGGSSGDDEETSSTEAPAEPTPTSTADEEEQPAPTTTQEGGEQPAPTTTGESAPSETEGGEASPTAAPTTTGEQGSPSATSTEGGEYPVSPAPTASTTYGGGNGTVPSGTTAPPEATETDIVPVAGAVALSGGSLGMYGALALGVVYAVMQ